MLHRCGYAGAPDWDEGARVAPLGLGSGFRDAGGAGGAADAVPPAFGAAVREDLADYVATRDAGDPTASVGGRTRLVQPPHRRPQVGVAGRRPGVEHLPQRQLPVEDVPADQTVLLL